MLEGLYFIATGWLLTAASLTAAKDQIAADEALLKSAALKCDGPALLDFFRKRTLLDSERESAGKLIRQLGSETYRLREQAMAELIGRGPVVQEMLRVALKDDDLE